MYLSRDRSISLTINITLFLKNVSLYKMSRSLRCWKYIIPLCAPAPEKNTALAKDSHQS